MASIIKDEKQIEALGEIEDGLNVIRQINMIMEAGDNGNFAITFTPKEGKSVSINSDEQKKLKDILVLKKDKLIKEINTKSKKHRIALSDEDLLIMGEKEV